MNAQRDFDQQLHDWMQDVPRVHPNLEATILEHTRRVPQQRRSWWSVGALANASRRAAPMMLTGLAGIFLLGLVGFVLLVILASPQDGPPVPAASGTPASSATPQATVPRADPSLDAVATPPAPASMPPSAALEAFEETMSGISTETLARGAERIVRDGPREEFITWSAAFADSGETAFRPVAGPTVDADGSVWLAGYRATGAVRLLRLGQASDAVLDTALSNDEGLWMRSDADGGLWVGGANDISHFDGRTWYWPDNEFVADVHAVQIMRDGSAWVIWSHDDGPVAGRLGRVDRDAWIDHEVEVAEALDVDPRVMTFRDVTGLPDGELRVLVVVGPGADDVTRTFQLALRDGAWSIIEPVGELEDARLIDSVSAPDGSLWHYYELDGDEAESPGPMLVHEQGRTITIASDAVGGMPAMRPHRDDEPPRDRLQVGPDGTVWLETLAGVIASFDGSAWTTRGVDGIDAFDIAPDGSAIVLDEVGTLSNVRPGGDPLLASSGKPTDASVSPSEDAATASLLERLETEESEPGVLHVLRDGFRPLTYTASSQDRRNLYSYPIVAGRDGSVWVFGADEYYRLGEERTYRWQESSPSYGQPPADGATRDREAGQVIEPSATDDIEVAADGTVWYALGMPGPWVYEGELEHSLWTFDGEGWTPVGPAGAANAVEVPGDGSVWARWDSGDPREPGLVVVRRRDENGWADVGQPVEPAARASARFGPGLHVSDDGQAWLTAGDIRHLDDGEWLPVPTPPDVSDYAYFDLGTDGTPWTSLQVSYANPGADLLARYDGSSWTTFAQDSMPETGNGRWQISHQVGPDGSLWIPLKGHIECGGIGNFDGETWRTYLPGTCVYAFDIAPDGSVWLHAGAIRWNALGDDLLAVRPIETYVISPSDR